jgi:phospho-N-acetylmuramoyl-pentapeptide-transferase
VFGLIGAFDDWAKLRNKSSKGLPGKLRLILQTIFALGVIALLSHPVWLQKLGLSLPSLQESGLPLDWKKWQSGIYFPFFSEPIFTACGIGWLLVFFLQWMTIVGSANAVNLTDGLDGLAGGLSVLSALAILIVAFLSNHQELATHHNLVLIESSGEVAICLGALVGATLGFLWFNSYPAQIFMGDTGSLAIGGMIGTAAVLLKREWFLGLVGALFVAETLSVVLQVLFFKHSGKRIFRCAPLHHHFEYGGIPETKVVVRFWIVGLLLAAFGIISLKFQ